MVLISYSVVDDFDHQNVDSETTRNENKIKEFKENQAIITEQDHAYIPISQKKSLKKKHRGFRAALKSFFQDVKEEEEECIQDVNQQEVEIKDYGTISSNPDSLYPSKEEQNTYINTINNKKNTKVCDPKNTMSFDGLPISRLFLKEFPEETETFRIQKKLIINADKSKIPLMKVWKPTWKESTSDNYKKKTTHICDNITHLAKLEKFLKNMKPKFEEAATTQAKMLELHILEASNVKKKPLPNVFSGVFSFDVDFKSKGLMPFKLWKKLLFLLIVEEHAYFDPRYRLLISLMGGLSIVKSTSDEKQARWTVKVWIKHRHKLTVVRDSFLQYGYRVFDQNIKDYEHDVKRFVLNLERYLKESLSRSYLESISLQKSVFVDHVKKDVIIDAISLGLSM